MRVLEKRVVNNISPKLSTADDSNRVLDQLATRIGKLHIEKGDRFCF